MDSLGFDKFDEMIAEANGMFTGGVLGAFEVLQEIVGTVTFLASQDPMSSRLCEEFYPWYMEHLVKLHDKAQRLAAQVPYQLKAYDIHHVARARITAVLETLTSLSWMEKSAPVSKAS